MLTQCLLVQSLTGALAVLAGGGRNWPPPRGVRYEIGARHLRRRIVVASASMCNHDQVDVATRTLRADDVLGRIPYRFDALCARDGRLAVRAQFAC